MFRRQVLAGLGVLVAMVAPAAALTGTASAATANCLGLDCPGVLSADSPGHSTSVPTVTNPRDLEHAPTSGFYEFGLNSPAHSRAVAYVSVPGQWAKAPADVKAVVGSGITRNDVDENTIVVYGNGFLVSAPTTDTSSGGVAATVASARKHHHVVKAHAAGAHGCPDGYFCIYDSAWAGARGQFASTSVWQDLSAWGWQNRAVAMVNARSGWSILSRNNGGGGARYCAQPNSEDSNLGNNGFGANTSSTYNSTSSTKHSEWGCSN
jgi:hypothetical protein